MLRALANAPGGLTTPQLTEIAGITSSWVNALGTTRQLMLKQQKQGRVKQAGFTDGDRTRPVALWRITDKGRQYIRGAAEAPPKPAPAQSTSGGGGAPAAGFELLLLAKLAAAERERVAREHQQAISRMLEGIWNLLLACAYGAEFDAEQAFTYINDAILHYTHGKIRSGEPLTRFERDMVDDYAAEYSQRVAAGEIPP